MPDEVPGAALPPGTMPPPPMAPSPGPGPTGPAAVPSPNRGLEAQAMVDISAALKLLKRAFVRLPDGDKKQKSVLSALTSLTKDFGPVSEGLEKSEMQALQATQPQAPGPQQGKAFAQMIQGMNQGRGIGAGAPPPIPSPAGAAPTA